MHRPDLNIPTYDIRTFTWVGRNGSAEASNMGLPPGVSPGQRVWSDSVDVGFMVRGLRETRLFVLTGEERQEGDVVGWTFRSLPAAVDACQILVVND